MDSSSRSHVDRNLLLGILALQVDFITREQLTAAARAWRQDKSQLLDDILVQQGGLKGAERQLLLPLVEQHIKNHDGDPARSLAALSSIGSLAEDLHQLGDEHIDATLSLVRQERRDTSVESTIHHSGSTGSGAGRKGETSSGIRFRILRPHAKGGLGEISVAKDVELNRDVALKEIQARFVDDEASRSRFMLEAEVTGGLEHPGVVPVYGLGRYDDGRPFYAMRFVKGDSLQEAANRFHNPTKAGADRVDFGGIGFRKLLGRFVDVCQAIEYAHSRGVLHRDLKPGNIMLGKYGETLVVDWGLAKTQEVDDVESAGGEALLQPASASGTAPTVMGSALGTPAFMPPEQAAGRLDELGPASDVYSLGATLYYLLTGRAPFQGADVVAILSDVQAGKYPAPRTVQPSAPKVLEAVCQKAMALKVDNRYQSPLHLADDIERYLADEAVTAFPEPLIARTRRWVRKHQTLSATTAAIVLVSIIGLGVFSTIVSRKNAALNKANLALDKKNNELDAKNEELVESYKRESDARVLAQRNEEAARQQSQLALSTLASVINDLDTGLRNLAGSHDLRQRLLKTSLEKLEDVAEPFVAQTAIDRNTINALNQLGDVVSELAGNRPFAAPNLTGAPLPSERDSGVRLARTFYTRAFELAEKLSVANPEDVEAQKVLLACCGKMGAMSYRDRRLQEATEFQEQAVNIGETLLAEHSTDIEFKLSFVSALGALGDMRFMKGELLKSLDLYQHALELSKELSAADPSSLNCLERLAQSHNRMGMVNRLAIKDYSAAVGHYERCVAIREHIAASDPTNVSRQLLLGHAYFTLGDACIKTTQMKKAEESLEKSLELATKIAAADVRNLNAQLDRASRMQSLGVLRSGVGDHSAAIELFRQSIQISEDLVAADPLDARSQHSLATGHNRIGVTYRASGQADKAVEQLTTSVEILKTLTIANPSNADIRRDLITTYGSLGEAKDAVRAQLVTGNWDTLMKQPDSQKGELLLERGIALAEAGKPDELIQVADALRKLNGGPRHNSLFDAACFYGECAEMVVRGSTAPLTGEQESQRSRLVSQSLDALREAVEAGWYDMELIDTTTSLKLARSLPQYQDVKTIDPGDNRSQAIHRDIQTVESEIQRLTQQIKAEPLNAYLYRDRAAKYARLRNWRNALQDHDMFNTKSGRAMNRLGMLRAATQNLLAGNITQYKEVCRQISSQFQGSPVPPEADVLCKSHLLLPGVNDTSKLPYQIIEKAVKQGQPDWFVPWGASTLALHAYRGGKWEAATNWTKSIDPHAWEQKPLAIGLAIQAMAEHRQGKPDEARQTLAKAAARIPADLRAMRPEETAGRLVPPLKAADVDWLIAEIFRREAEATLGGKTPEEYVNSWETNPSIEE